MCRNITKLEIGELPAQFVQYYQNIHIHNYAAQLVSISDPVCIHLNSSFKKVYELVY